MAFTGLNCDFSFKTYYAKFLLWSQKLW
jgi:hypothetical protein